MEYLAFVKQLELSYWLMIAGGVLVLFGIIGVAAYPPIDILHLHRKVAPTRADPSSLPPPTHDAP